MKEGGLVGTMEEDGGGKAMRERHLAPSRANLQDYNPMNLGVRNQIASTNKVEKGGDTQQCQGESGTFTSNTNYKGIDN